MGLVSCEEEGEREVETHLFAAQAAVSNRGACETAEVRASSVMPYEVAMALHICEVRSCVEEREETVQHA